MRPFSFVPIIEFDEHDGIFRPRAGSPVSILLMLDYSRPSRFIKRLQHGPCRAFLSQQSEHGSILMAVDRLGYFATWSREPLNADAIYSYAKGLAGEHGTAL